MRHTLQLLKNARLPQNEKLVPFQEILPLRLKNTVSGKSDSRAEVACLQEMTVLFACLKTNEFNQGLCSKEIGTMKSCYKAFLDSEQIKKATQSKGIVVPGKDLNYKQLNKVLKNYPALHNKKVF